MRVDISSLMMTLISIRGFRVYICANCTAGGKEGQMARGDRDEKQ